VVPQKFKLLSRKISGTRAFFYSLKQIYVSGPKEPDKMLKGEKKMSKIPHRLYLTEEQIPKQWYSMRADMKELPDPIINPGTMKPAAVEDLYPVFCEKLAKQEMDDVTRYIDIP